MKKINFEESLERLEEITAKLESQDISLEESLKMFEEGIKLSRFCENKLTEAEQKLEVLKSDEIKQFSKNSDKEDLDDTIQDTSEQEKKNKRKSLKKAAHQEEENKDDFLF